MSAGCRPGDQRGRDVQVLDGHRFAVDQPQPGDVGDLGGGRDPQLAADAGAGRHGGELQHPAGPGARGRRQAVGVPAGGEFLGDLGAGDEHAAPVLAYEQAGGDQFVDGRAQGGAGDAELVAQGALGGDRVAGGAGLDEFHQVVADSFAFQRGARRFAGHGTFPLPRFPGPAVQPRLSRG